MKGNQYTLLLLLGVMVAVAMATIIQDPIGTFDPFPKYTGTSPLYLSIDSSPVFN